MRKEVVPLVAVLVLSTLIGGCVGSQSPDPAVADPGSPGSAPTKGWQGPTTRLTLTLSTFRRGQSGWRSNCGPPTRPSPTSPLR